MSQAFHGGRLDEARLKFQRDDFLDFSVNTNAFWQPPALPPSVASRNAVAQYPEADAATLATQLASLYFVDPAHILPTAGAIEALYLATRLFAGKTALLFHPSFADYSRACSASGVQTQSASLLPEPPDIDSTLEQLRSVDLVILGNPNNPTGRLFPNLAELIAHPRLQKLAWIVDEAFIEFTPAPEQTSLLSTLGKTQNVLLLRALTKSWSIPGLRLGFLATSNPQWKSRVQSWQPPWPIHGITEAWSRLHLSPENQSAMRASLSQLGDIRADFAEALNRLPGLKAQNSHANFLLLECASANAQIIANALGELGILVRLCRGFEGLQSSTHLRLAVRTRPENERVLAALESLLHPQKSASLKRQSPERRMRSISVLGTSSNSGKSWVATALCAWLRRKGLRVAPFKAQNMSNNSAVTPDGGEIGRAQAVQAEACRLAPSVRMNPILLKPSGNAGSQLVRLGRAEGHVKAADYYKIIETLWPTVTESLAYWETQCDALVIEGAGSPVELNLMHRDLVNFRPVRHLDSHWLLVADIERGGVFAQAAGTWALTPPEDQSRCMGLIVNKFRGDLSLFADAAKFFAPHFGAPFLGTLPFASQLQPENEDSLSEEPNLGKASAAPIHWIRFPHTSNSQDTNPWSLDEGVRVEWVQTPKNLEHSSVIVLPGSKNTISDLRWLKTSGLAEAISAASQRGALVLGICGGFQMLGEKISDPLGVAGDSGEEDGLGLLPLHTWFAETKETRTVEAIFQGERWDAYEIHMGRTTFTSHFEPLLQVADAQGPRDEGCRRANVWGTYLHGFFEAVQVRREICRLAGVQGHRPSLVSFRKQREQLYDGMADLLEEHLNLEELWRYVAH
jgi:adenosylcobyric acid synthase